VLRNPIATLKHYRLYTIFKIPSLTVLDFKKVKQRERDEAQILYKGKKLKSAAAANKTFVPGDQLNKLSLNNPASGGAQQQLQMQQRIQPSKEDMDAIRLLINQAKSIEEIERLNHMLRSGVIPSHIRQQQQQQHQQQHQFSRRGSNKKKLF
jgi:U2 small nuclear ribonucleoprotein A'